MVVKHFVGSLAAAPLLPAWASRAPSSDCGTGARFPCVPLARFIDGTLCSHSVGQPE